MKDGSTLIDCRGRTTRVLTDILNETGYFTFDFTIHSKGSSFVKSETSGILERVLMSRDGTITLSSESLMYSFTHWQRYQTFKYTTFELGVTLTQPFTSETPTQIQYSQDGCTYLITTIFFPNVLT